MKRTFMTTVALIALTAGALLIAQASHSTEALLKAAQHKEEVEGDLPGAIEDYRKIAQAGDRAVAARALIHMAECYQKMGDAESQKIYERIVREYSDQKEAAGMARARLGRGGRMEVPSTMTSRRLWAPPSHYSWDVTTGATISPDGRLVSYTEWDTGNLGMHEFATGRGWRVTNNTTYGSSAQHDEWAEESAISRDSKQVAYSWFNGKDRYQLRVASVEGAGRSQWRMLFDNPEFEFVCPFDWSPDGNWILVELTRMDHTDQMGLISVRDGSLRVLKSAEWSGSTELFFSPDGKYIGFDARVGDTSNAPRDVFILAVDGSRQVPVTEGSSNDTMMGWSPDGKYVLVASDRGGSTGLWAVPLVDGRPKGTPELVKADISRFSLGVSASGSLYTGVPAGDRDIRVASVDFETGRLLAAPVRPAQSFVGTNSRPVWSPDGKYLAYTSNRPPPVYNSFLMVQSVETGQLRELKPKLTYINNFRWTPDGQGFIVGGRDLKGRQGQYHVDGQTTEVTPITAMGQSSPDGRKVYFRKDLGPDGFAFVERELVSGAERELVRGKDLRGLGLSPDGRFIATAHTDGKSWILLLVPISGGETRELLRVSKPQSLSVNLTWMADSRAVLVNKGLNENDTENELWFVPIAGGQPHKIDLGADQFEGAVNVHPDGRRIAYVSGDRREEVWVLENFLPALNAKK